MLIFLCFISLLVIWPKLSFYSLVKAETVWLIELSTQLRFREDHECLSQLIHHNQSLFNTGFPS